MLDKIMIEVEHKNYKKFLELHEELNVFISDFLGEKDKNDEVKLITTWYTEEVKD